MSTIYSILDRDARRWWYNADLRRAGMVKEARNRERDSIKRNAQTLRKALRGGWLSIGRGGWTLHYEKGARLSHYGGLDEPIPQCCLLLHIPIIDTTTIPDDRITETIRFPMAAFEGECDEPPYNSLSFAPLDHVASLYKGLGATLYNL